MSHDISLTCTCCGGEVFDRNYTSNINPMLREAGIWLGDEQWQGKPGVKMLPALDTAIAAMLADPAKFRALEPENRWGDYPGALALLRVLRESIDRVPTAIYRDNY